MAAKIKLTEAQARRLDAGHGLGKPHKYGAKATVVDGIRFDSKAEARRWGELKLLEKAGKIKHLRRQLKIPLRVFGIDGLSVIGHYVADFEYVDTAAGGTVLEDVKGMDTRMSAWKRKHVEAEYGIKVRVVK